ncbi:hypothetical protein [Acidithiobacillus sp.]
MAATCSGASALVVAAMAAPTELEIRHLIVVFTLKHLRQLPDLG